MVPDPGGLLLLDKPAGPSSFAAIARLRPVFGRRLGHAGTLDPFATGLLLVLVGRCTRLAALLTGVDKRYRAVVQFGASSTTDDPEGDVRPEGGRVATESIAEVLPHFRGRITQVPPAASAIHIDGQRAYARFRRGEEVQVPPREVEIHDLALVDFDEAGQRATFDVACSTGTYVRALARDLGAAAGSAAYCRELRRTAVGAFSVDDAASPAVALERPTGSPHWRPAADALPHVAAVDLDDADVAAIRHGRRIPHDAPAGTVALRHDGRLIAIGRSEDGSLAPTIVLEPA